ncbi:hypothetical protein [Umezawaea beigongshangensis]|uniref:hypothetical protein n=1 Tax=Umezawaea beigongshangensis TaxID=2780383 RepID=UPI0018F1C33D|nr:hypothetical protein [Umezawaea beigongshangensis]
MTVAEDVADSSSAPAQAVRRRSWPVFAAAALLALLPLAFQAVTLPRGFFWQDDFRYLIRVTDQPLTPELLFTGYNGHLMPGQFLLVWAVTAISPLNFPLAVAPLLLLHGAAAALLWRLLVRLFTARWALLTPFAVFTCSPLLLVSTRWWGFALQVVPMVLTLIGAVDAQVRHVLTGRTRDLVAGLLWVVTGALCWQKALLAVPVLIAVTGIAFGLRAHRRSIAAHTALLLALAAGYVALADDAVAGGPSAASQWLALAPRMIADTFVPGVLGGPWLLSTEGPTAWAVPPLPVRLTLWAVAAAVVVTGLLVGRRRAALAWLLLTGYLAVAVVLVGVTRLSVIGSVIGGDPRYVADAVPVAVLCAALAFCAPGAAPRPVSGRGGAALAALGVVVVAGSAVTVVRADDGGRTAATERYVATLREGLRRDPAVVLYDRRVPVEMMNPWFGDLSNLSEVVRVVPEVAPRFDGPAETLHVVDDLGNPRPLTVDVRATGAAGTVPECGHPVGRNPVEIPLSAPMTAPRQVVRLDYFTGAAGAGVLRAGGREVEVRFDTGLHTLHVVVPDPFSSVTLWTTEATAGVCVDGVVAGPPASG